MPQVLRTIGNDTAQRAEVQVETRFGTMQVVWRGDALCRLQWTTDPRETDVLPTWQAFAARATETQCRFVEDLVAYTEGEYISFYDVPILLAEGTNLRQRIWRTCQKIPYGETVTYGQLARMAGRPGAARAVGTAMANNQIPLVIPCHRVVAAGNKLGGFSSPQGTNLKRMLLEMENQGRIRADRRQPIHPLTSSHPSNALGFPQ